MRKLALLGAIFLGFAGAAQARPRIHSVALVSTCSTEQALTVVNHANVRAQALQWVEKAVADQVNGALHRRWATPCVKFGAGGWKIYLRYGWRGATENGIHAFSPDGTDNVQSFPDAGPSGVWGPPNIPFADVLTSGDTYGQWSETFDHELIEMLVNPYGIRAVGDQPAEIADPVETNFYEADHGVFLSDFVYPSYFQPGVAGPYDLAGMVHAPLIGSSGTA